jgi:hypothetical protein
VEKTSEKTTEKTSGKTTENDLLLESLDTETRSIVENASEIRAQVGLVVENGNVSWTWVGLVENEIWTRLGLVVENGSLVVESENGS